MRKQRETYLICEVKMIDLPINAEVYCADGPAGHSTYIVCNPSDRQITDLVVKTHLPPFHEYLVPVDQVDETAPNRIMLKCTRKDLLHMKPFEVEVYIKTEVPGYVYWSSIGTDVPAIPGYTTEPETTYMPVKQQNIPLGELAVHRGARVEATDGYIGKVDELLIDSNDKQVTHIILKENLILTKREVSIPIRQIQRVDKDTVYLKLDRQGVEELPTTPIERWPDDVRYSNFERRINMDKMLVVVFDSEAKAYEGSKALQELQDEGSINLYAKTVITRDASGKVVVKQEGDQGPIGTAVGMLTGSLVGLIGGPVGLILGGGAGMSMGLLYDLMNLGVGEDYLDEVKKTLLPGKAAVVAEVWEEWTTPVDTRMESLGGEVLRKSRSEIVDEQNEQDAMALKAELADLKAEHKQATGKAKANLQKKVDTVRGKLQAAQDNIQARIDSSQKETDAKVAALQKQAAKDSGERKAKREARIAELKAEQKRRSEKLKQAWEHTKEALSD
jgi:uncharacterized membrane protein/sporulation protein YlmC with PRC-barrel domain